MFLAFDQLRYVPCLDFMRDTFEDLEDVSNRVHLDDDDDEEAKISPDTVDISKRHKQ